MICQKIYNILKQINIPCAFIAFIHFGLSFFTDRFIFFLPGIIGNTDLFEKYIIFKIILLGILFGIWQIIAFMIIEYKSNENIRKWLKYSFLYFIIMMIFLLLTWPGIWRCDELGMCQSARSLYINYWQGFIIIKIYIIFLMLLPFPSGILIIQNIIIALIVGYTVLKVQIYFNPIRVDYLMFIPFLLLSVVDNNLYPMRTTLYAYVWLLLIIKIMFMNLKNKPTLMDIFTVFSLSLLMYLFRNEGILCLFFMPVIFYFFNYRLMDKRQKIISIILYIVCVLTIFYVQKAMSFDNLDKRYAIYNISSSISKVYLNLDGNEQKKILKIIDNIVDASEFVKGSKMDIHRKEIIKNFTKNEYNEFIKLYFRLAFQYRYSYLQERFIEFVNSSENIWETTKLFDKNSEYEQFGLISLKSFQPININLRKKVISFIERRDINNYSLKLLGFGIFYKPLQLIFIMLFVSLIFFIFKEYKNLIICFLLFATTGIVIILSPAQNFIYYFYLYLSAYVLLTISMIKISLKFKGFFYAFKK